ncbi:MAG: hypothetical protein RL538_587 [Candidatus Parcubacteria bacterium]
MTLYGKGAENAKAFSAPLPSIFLLQIDFFIIYIIISADTCFIHFKKELPMSRFSALVDLTSINEWWFEVAMGRPVLTVPYTNLDEIRQYAFQAPDNSEEKYAGYLAWVDTLDTLEASAETDTELEFIIRNAPSWFTKSVAAAWRKKEKLHSERHPRAYRREFIEMEGVLASFNRQLELVETLDECYDIYNAANHRCPAVLEATFEKMLTLTSNLSDIKEVHDLSLYWYKSKLLSIRKMVELHEAGTLEL